MLARGEDAVHVADLEPGVPHRVGDGLEVQGELLLWGSVPISSLSSTPTMQAEFRSSFIGRLPRA